MTMRRRAWADSISLNAIAMPAALELGPFVTRWRTRTTVSVARSGTHDRG